MRALFDATLYLSKVWSNFVRACFFKENTKNAKSTHFTEENFNLKFIQNNLRN
jgi:hypothetical protein